ncbi:hypothetical protein TYRP_021629, partial [Tyrophagus putrescentiae]
MFMASFEHLLFRRLIVDNEKLIYTGDKNYDTSQTIHYLATLEKLVSLGYNRRSFQNKTASWKKLTQLDPTYNHIHKEIRKSKKTFKCERLEFTANYARSEHETEFPSHKLLALGQFALVHSKTTVDLLI